MPHILIDCGIFLNNNMADKAQIKFAVLIYKSAKKDNSQQNIKMYILFILLLLLVTNKFLIFP